MLFAVVVCLAFACVCESTQVHLDDPTITRRDSLSSKGDAIEYFFTTGPSSNGNLVVRLNPCSGAVNWTFNSPALGEVIVCNSLYSLGSCVFNPGNLPPSTLISFVIAALVDSSSYEVLAVSNSSLYNLVEYEFTDIFWLYSPNYRMTFSNFNKVPNTIVEKYSHYRYKTPTPSLTSPFYNGSACAIREFMTLDNTNQVTINPKGQGSVVYGPDEYDTYIFELVVIDRIYLGQYTFSLASPSMMIHPKYKPVNTTSAV